MLGGAGRCFAPGQSCKAPQAAHALWICCIVLLLALVLLLLLLLHGMCRVMQCALVLGPWSLVADTSALRTCWLPGQAPPPSLAGTCTWTDADERSSNQTHGCASLTSGKDSGVHPMLLFSDERDHSKLLPCLCTARLSSVRLALHVHTYHCALPIFTCKSTRFRCKQGRTRACPKRRPCAHR